MAAAIAISGSLLAAPGCIIVSDDDSVDGILTVDNQSDFFVDEIYVAPVGTTDYGPNLAPSDGLAPDDVIDIEVSCDDYDLLLVDEESVECEVLDIDLCLRDALVVFRNNSCSLNNATGTDGKAGTVKKKADQDAGTKADSATTNAPATQI